MTRAFDEIVEFIAGGSTSQDVSQYRPSAETSARVDSLLRKEKNEGLLPEETVELNDYLQLEHLMRMAKARARKKLEA